MLSAAARASIRIAIILVLALAGAGPASAQLVPLEVWDWTAWENLGGPVFGVPACVSSAPNRLDCFARGTDGLLYRRWWDGASWHGWDAAPGLIIQMAYQSGPSCVAVAPNRVDCFVRAASDDTLYHRWWQDGVAGWWESLGAGVLTSDASCVATGQRIDCFGRGTDGALYRKSFDGNIWQAWSGMGGQILDGTRPACVGRSGNRIDCVVAWTDNHLRSVSYDGSSWGAWTQMQGGYALDSPKCTAQSGSALNCVARTQDQSSGVVSLGRWSLNGASWAVADLGDDFGGVQAYQQLGAMNSYDVECVARGADRVDCIELIGRAYSYGFSQGPQTTQLRQFYWDSTGASGWVDTGKTLYDDRYLGLSCASWSSDRIDCFAASGWLSSSSLFHTAYFKHRVILQRP